MSSGGLDVAPVADPIERAQALATVQAALFGDDAPKQRLGRYLLIEQRGSGSMGIVFSAYDPQLDRKVALKLLRRSVTQDSRDSTRDGVLREARAMARLSHPNVVTVHEVGEEGDRIYLAMEYVANGSLRDWLSEPEHSVQEVVRVFTGAGRGLAAAHEAGLVHRDFKPENVLLTKEGEPRVADFGLARMGGHRPLEATPQGSGRDPLMTSGGAGCVGTPAYMAPEVFAGGAADPRSDQFSFCVALHEALCGRRPFRGEDLETLRKNVEQGGADESDELRDVPAALRRVVARGLDADPAERFDSMPALLDALKQGIEPRRRLGWWAAGGVALVLLGGLAVWKGMDAGHDSGPVLCEGGEAKAAQVWSAERGARLASELSGTPRQRTHFLELGDAYAQAWRAAHREACLDTAVRRVQTASRMDARMLCLDGRLRSFAGALRALRSQPDGKLHTASTVLGGLPSIEACADPRRLEGKSSAGARDAILAVEEELGRARALERLKDPEQAMAITEELIPRARELENPRLLTRTLLALGLMEIRTGQPGRARAHLDAGRLEAERAGLDYFSVQALTMQATDAVMQQELDQARRYLDVARAILERYGGDLELEAALDGRMGVIAYHSGDLDGAVKHYRRQLATLAEAGTSERETGVSARINLGLSLRDLGHNDEALDVLKESRAKSVALHGDQNPTLPVIDLHIAMVLDELGQFSEALDVLQRGLDVLLATRGPESVDAVQIHAGFGLVYERVAEYQKGLEHDLEAIRVLEALGQDEHPDMAMCQSYAGTALVYLGRADEGLEHQHVALAINEGLFGPDDPEVAATLVQLGNAQRATGDFETAARSLERAIEILLDAQQPRHEVGDVRRQLAKLVLDSDPVRARELAELALEDFRASPFDAADLEAELEAMLED